MRADHAKAPDGGDRSSPPHRSRRRPAESSAGDGPVPGRFLHLQGNRHPPCLRAPRPPGRECLSRGLSPGAVERRAADPLRRPAPTGPPRRLDLPGTPSRRAPARMNEAHGRLVPATYDTVVIGAGLAGLTAALRLAEEGQRVLVLAKGVGATHLAPATIDVLGYHDGTVASPAHALPAFTAANPDHPYGHLPLPLVRASLEWFKTRTDDLGYRGSIDENALLPTAVGVAKPAALVPETMSAGDVRRGGRFVFVGLRGLKDFYASYLADNLSRAER